MTSVLLPLVADRRADWADPPPHPWEPLIRFSQQSRVTQKGPFVLAAWTSPASPSGLWAPLCGITGPGSSVEHPARSSPYPYLAPKLPFPQDYEGRWRGPLLSPACAFFNKSYSHTALVTHVYALWQLMIANDITLDLRSGVQYFDFRRIRSHRPSALPFVVGSFTHLSLPGPPHRLGLACFCSFPRLFSY